MEIEITQKTKSPNSEPKLDVVRRGLARYLTEPAAALLAKTSITPNAVTWFGFVLACGAGALVATGYLPAAGIVVLAAGYFDIVDGALARRTNRVTRFGGVLDSTLDRLSESVLLLCVTAYFLFSAQLYREWLVLLTGVTLVSSLLISYIRSRAESADIECKVGISTRTERVILLALGLLVNQPAIALIIIALLNLITIVQRLVHVLRQARQS